MPYNPNYTLPASANPNYATDPSNDLGWAPPAWVTGNAVDVSKYMTDLGANANDPVDVSRILASYQQPNSQSYFDKMFGGGNLIAGPSGQQLFLPNNPDTMGTMPGRVPLMYAQGWNGGTPSGGFSGFLDNFANSGGVLGALASAGLQGIGFGGFGSPLDAFSSAGADAGVAGDFSGAFTGATPGEFPSIGPDVVPNVAGDANLPAALQAGAGTGGVTDALDGTVYSNPVDVAMPTKTTPAGIYDNSLVNQTIADSAMQTTPAGPLDKLAQSFANMSDAQKLMLGLGAVNLLKSNNPGGPASAQSVAPPQQTVDRNSLLTNYADQTLSSGQNNAGSLRIPRSIRHPTGDPYHYGEGAQQKFFDYPAARGGQMPPLASHAQMMGAQDVTSPMSEAASRGFQRGPGGGQDDKINARLSPGEFVFDASTVSDIGDGSSHAGAQRLDQLREKIRAHKRSAPAGKIPPKAKALGQYQPVLKRFGA